MPALLLEVLLPHPFEVLVLLPLLLVPVLRAK